MKIREVKIHDVNVFPLSKQRKLFPVLEMCEIIDIQGKFFSINLN